MKMTIAIGLCAFLAACGNSENKTTTTTNDDSMNTNLYDTTHKVGMDDTTHIVAITVDPADTSFISMAAKGGAMEVDLGNMANIQASSDRVKQFAAMMVRDHTNANNELSKIAGDLSGSTSYPKTMQMQKDHLAKLNGSAFDKAYMLHMVSDHKEDIALFEKASKNARTQAIKDFANNTLPTLKLHLDSAIAVQKSLK